MIPSAKQPGLKDAVRDLEKGIGLKPWTIGPLRH